MLPIKYHDRWIITCIVLLTCWMALGTVNASSYDEKASPSDKSPESQQSTNNHGIRVDLAIKLNELAERRSREAERHLDGLAGKGDKKLRRTVSIAIVSAFTNHQKRDVVRKTWLKLLNKIKDHRYIYKFFIAKKDIPSVSMLKSKTLRALVKEFRQHDDIIQLDCEEQYENLATKTLKMMQWNTQHLEFDYLFKVDDDAFVMANTIVGELLHTSSRTSLAKLYANEKGSPNIKKRQPFTGLYWGWFHKLAEVRTDRTDKNWEPHYSDSPYFPNYASGSGYVLSGDVVKWVTRASYSQPRLRMLRNEDANLGVWLTPLNLSRVHDVRFNQEYCSEGMLTAHPVTKRKMERLWRNLEEQNGGLCGGLTFLGPNFVEQHPIKRGVAHLTGWHWALMICVLMIAVYRGFVFWNS